MSGFRPYDPNSTGGGGGGVTEWVLLDDTPGSISANLIVQGNSNGTVLEFGQDLNTTGSPTFDDMTLTGSITSENGSVAAPSYRFTSHTTTGLSANATALDLSVNGIIGLGVVASTTPVNGVRIEMSDTGDPVTVVPEGVDAGIDLDLRAKGGNVAINSINGDVILCAGAIMKVSPIGTAVVIDGDVTADNFNGVSLTTAGAATNFLNETGSYSVPPDLGGNVTTSATLTDNFVVVGNGTEDVDVSTASFNGDDLTIVGSLTVENGSSANPSIRFATHALSGVSVGSNILDISVNGQSGVRVIAGNNPVNGLFVEMADTGNAVNVVPGGSDGSIPLHLRAKGADVLINQIAGDTKIGLNDALTVTSSSTVAVAGTLGVSSISADTSSIASYATTGTNGGSYTDFVGDRNPNENITGAGGNKYTHVEGELSGEYLSLAATTGTEWFKYSVNAPTVIEIHSPADFENLVSGGVYTVTTTTLLVFSRGFNTASEIVINSNVSLSCIGRHRGQVGILYTGTGTFISGDGNFYAAERFELENNQNGTLFNLTGDNATLAISGTSLSAWLNLGTLTNIAVLIDTVEVEDIVNGFVLQNVREIAATRIFMDSTPSSGVLFTFDTIGTLGLANSYSFRDIRGQFTSTGSLFDFSPDIPIDVQISVSECTVNNGNIFKQSVNSLEPFTLVSDTTVNGTITSAADNGAGLTRIFSSEDIFNGDLVSITNTTDYDGTIKAFDVNLGVSFDINILFNVTQTGDVESKRILLFANPNTVANGDTLEVTNSQFYNGFYRVLDSTANEIEVNGDFIATDSGDTVKDIGLDERDPRINAYQNLHGSANSRTEFFAEINFNTALTAISSSSFQPLNLGTVINHQSTEGFNLVDASACVYEYIGIEDINFSGEATITSIKTGGSADYDFALDYNGGILAGPNFGITHATVTSDRTDSIFIFNVDLVTGDRFSINVVGDGTADDIVISDFKFVGRRS